MTEPVMLEKLQKTVEEFKTDLLRNLYRVRGAAMQSASINDMYNALAYTVRDYLVDNFQIASEVQFQQNPKFVYYLSAEYLLGRQLEQNLLYTGMTDIAREALSQLDIDYQEVMSQDIEPGLGNGGLGRLAACFMDSLATLNVPAVGYGIRYEYGIFKQDFKDGWQVETPDEWLLLGNPWEFVQPDSMVEVGFGGHTEYYNGEGELRVRWVPSEAVRGEPFHMLVPAYGSRYCNLLRLWRARASQEFDFQVFDVGDYSRAVEQKIYSENISKVLYPNDNMLEGKILRLKQQYFFVACSLKDIIRRFHLRNEDWSAFPEKTVIQLNDTHPTVAIPELMRILVDEEMVPWDKAWDITTRSFAYTCHTLMPEALERWPVSIFGKLLPRHMEIVNEINRRFLNEVRARFPGDASRVARMSIIEDSGMDKLIRMANLATVGSFSVNGVAELHSQLLRDHTLRDFAEMMPHKFNNKTNGVTPRRFVRLANPRLSSLITDKIGDGWLKDLDELKKLEPFANDAAFRKAWRAVKQANKEDLAGIIQSRTGVSVNPNSIYDVIVKRLHEYKRQLLKAMHIIALYHRIKDNPNLDMVPRTFIFGAKAAPGYYMAKRVIKLVNSVAEVVNHDPVASKYMRVVFLPNFNVSLAEKIYPAAEISEQISMAGKEASGTGNMKFALNGALTTGTLDGANVEIREQVGAENFFLFGLTAPEVMELKARGYDPQEVVRKNPVLKRVIDDIAKGAFSNGDTSVFKPIVDSLLFSDEYLTLIDFQSYVDIHDAVDRAYRDTERWTKMSILNSARCGFFSSDRSMREYCDDIWNTGPVTLPQNGNGNGKAKRGKK
jgi:starch phosphorylase